MDDTSEEEPPRKSWTTLPPPEPPHELLAVLAKGEPVIIVDSDGTKLELPAEVAATLRDTVTAMAHDKAVTVVPWGQSLDAREAADFLDYPHATVLELLDEGEIPYKEVEPPDRGLRGPHRIMLADLLDYQKRQAVRRRECLIDIVRIAEAEEHDLYEITARDPGPLR